MTDTATGGNSAPEDALITIYYWRRGFVLLAPSFVLDRRDHPYHRLSATLMLAQRAPVRLETGDGDELSAQALLIAPKVTRRRLSAIASDLMICDMGVTTPECHALMPLLGKHAVCPLDADRLAPLADDIGRARQGLLAPEAMKDLLHRMVFALTGQHPEPPQLHPRISHALQLIQEHPLPVITPDWLSRQVHLSASRLRYLFSHEVGSSLSHYLRWSAVWKGAWLWSRGQPLSRIAEAVGFYDPAHLNRAFNEVFGLNPSDLFRPEQVRLIRCDWD